MGHPVLAVVQAPAEASGCEQALFDLIVSTKVKRGKELVAVTLAMQLALGWRCTGTLPELVLDADAGLVAGVGRSLEGGGGWETSILPKGRITGSRVRGIV